MMILWAVLLALFFYYAIIALYLVLKSWDKRTWYDPFSLVGEEGTVVEALAPEGLVKVKGEIWRAEPVGPVNIAEGRWVRVIEQRETKLIVEEVKDNV